MRNKVLILLLILLALISISAVSASDNQTALEDSGEINDVSDDVSVNEGDVAVRNDSQITVSTTKGYDNVATKFMFTLTSNNQTLSNCSIKINLNGVDYSKRTNDKGNAYLTVQLAKGTYNLSYSYAGDNNTAPCAVLDKVTIYTPVKTVIQQADKDINYRQGLKSVFIVRLLKSNGACVKNQNVTFKVNGKTYTNKTDSKGYAQIFLSLKKGTYTVKYSFSSNAPYLASSGSCKITVKSAMPKGNGYWMWASGMKSTNLKTLKDKGTKVIFLNSYAISAYGRSAVQSWIAKANSYGIKVHIWMQVCYDGKWIRPIRGDGSIDYGFLKKKVNQAVSYAKIKGVAGVHFDYVRFGGTAHLYKNSNNAINYFVKKACVEVRKVNPNCVMSAAIMPEPDMMDYYYGQDIPTMTKYLDSIVIMAYKGNYEKDASWIGDVTRTFVSQSNGAQVWTGLQAYQSDSNVVRLAHSELLNDAKVAVSAGAKGVVLFRIGVTNLLNFAKV